MSGEQNDDLQAMLERQRLILDILGKSESLNEKASALLAEYSKLRKKTLPHTMPSKESIELSALAERLKARKVATP